MFASREMTFYHSGAPYGAMVHPEIKRYQLGDTVSSIRVHDKIVIARGNLGCLVNPKRHLVAP